MRQTACGTKSPLFLRATIPGIPGIPASGKGYISVRNSHIDTPEWVEYPEWFYSKSKSPACLLPVCCLFAASQSAEKRGLIWSDCNIVTVELKGKTMPKRESTPDKLEPMPLHQALALANCLIDFEIENSQITPPPVDWLEDLRRARVTLSHLFKQVGPPPLPRDNTVFGNPPRRKRKKPSRTISQEIVPQL